MNIRIAALSIAVAAFGSLLAVDQAVAQRAHSGAPGAGPVVRHAGPARPAMRAPAPRVHYGGHRHSIGHRHHSRVGGAVFIAPLPLYGAPYSPWYYGDPYWRYHGDPYWGYRHAPSVIAVPVEPPVYIERSDPVDGSGDSVYSTTPSRNAPDVFYWCFQPRGYYPDVAECPGGWLPVERDAD